MLKLNIGLSRKVGMENYGSRGASVHVEVEVESSLVTSVDKLQDRIRQVFNLVRASLDEELNGPGRGEPRPSTNGNGQQPAKAVNGNGQRQTSGGNGSAKGRRATTAQLRAVRAIANRVGADLPELLRERFHVSRPDDLSIGDASTLIDQLKAAAGA
jgi:hypothetical protein